MGEAATTRRLLVVAALAIAVIAVAALTVGAGGETHRVSVTVGSATNVVEGQLIRAAGHNVGSVESIEPVSQGRAARIVLAIDDKAWPLARGSKMVLRWGGTVSYANRYIALFAGPPGAPTIPENGTFPTKDFTVPLEFDKLIATFTAPVRNDLRRFLATAGIAIDTAKPDLRRVLERLPAALDQTAPAVRDLAAETKTLETLVRSTDAVVNSVHRADPGVGRLVSGAATTLKAVAQNAGNVQATLDRVPGTFARARRTMRRADHTLGLAAVVTDRLSPGVQEARRLAVPLNGVLKRLDAVGPDARTTLATARRATPDLNTLLARLTRDSPVIESVSRQAIPQLDCIRPYIPDIINITSTWADFFSHHDTKDHWMRILPKVLVPTPYNANPMTSGQLQRLNPDMRYAFPIPPGHLVGQPWFQPQCGIGPEVYDADKDPEARQRYGPVDPIATNSRGSRAR